MNEENIPLKIKPYPWKCGNCRLREVYPETIEYTTDVLHDGRTYSVTVPDLVMPRCRKCGEMILLAEADSRISAALRSQVGLLPPERIRQGRESLGLTQKEMANLLGVATAARKSLEISWWRCLEIEDRKSSINVSDVLRPTSLPTDKLTTDYVQALRYPPILRTAGNVGENKFFSSEEGRDLLEQEFLKKGLYIRSVCPNLNKYQRPLGNIVLDTLGFGSLFVTFRNCPNNCPLALWAGDPWYPMFPRKVN